MIESLQYLELKRALIIRSLTGSHSSNVLTFSLHIIIATPLWCMSLCPEYKMVWPVFTLIFPDFNHRHSLTPKMSIPYFCISLATWAVFDVSNIVQTFHAPTQSFSFGPKRLSVGLLWDVILPSNTHRTANVCTCQFRIGRWRRRYVLLCAWRPVWSSSKTCEVKVVVCKA